ASGPSVTTGGPSAGRTVLVCRGSASGSVATSSPDCLISSSNPSISSIRSLRDEKISRMSALSYRRIMYFIVVSASSHPAIADVRRQWGMEDLGGFEIELGDAVEYPLAGPEQNGCDV